MDIPESLKEVKQSLLDNEAIQHIGACTGMIEMLKRKPDFAITVEVNDESFGLCNNAAFIKLLQLEIRECEKCIKGQKNKFE